MKKNFFWRVSLILSATVLSILFFLPSTSLRSSMPEWLKDYGLILGLDLQGGVHLVYEVDGDKAAEITAERIAGSLTNIFKEKGVDAKAELLNLEITVKPGGDKVENVINESYPNLELVTKTEGMISYKLSDKEIKSIKDLSADQALETIRNRIDAFGVSEPTIMRQGASEIVVQLPGVKDANRAIELVGKTAVLEFKLLDEENPLALELPGSIEADKEAELLAQYAGRIPEGDEILFEKVSDDLGNTIKRVYLVKKQAQMTGDFLTEARVNIDQRGNQPYVGIEFNSTGAEIFKQITTNNVKKRLAIILDNNVYSAPSINEPIPNGSAQITGSYTMEEAKDLVIVLRSGSLPAPLKMLQNVTVGPSLGKDSIDAGIKAGLIGALLVIIFMIVYYKLSGLIADFALVLNIVFLIGVLSVFKATLTMPGIAGIILAIGMAVDSNVLMFERMRDELRLGKTPRSAIDSGYDKAFWTIFDSHVTTLITAVVLFQFGTGPIKGFAVTLGWGVLINLFTALVGTKTVFDLITSKYDIKRLSI
ncbi:MAG: protein translocase subunit SecD [Nitrospirae bacterium]|nr:protein translocase subunit SecD [Nitrospirota bacterium]